MKSLRVAIIDDNSIFCYVLTKFMEQYKQAEIIVHVFENGQLALDYCRLHQNEKDLLPKLFFLDINMPLVDGWKFLDIMIAEKIDVFENSAFYIVSTSDNRIDLNKSKEYNFIKDYLIKPFTQDKLFGVLDNCSTN